MNTLEHTQPNVPAKRPYVKPEIVYQEPLEAMAAACTTGATPKVAGPVCVSSLSS
jgi:hypothetical protein